jgi:outer membrane lipoprotein SlyB
MNKHTFAVLLSILAAFVLIGCSGGTATEVSFSDVCQLENDHKNLSTEGYFATRVTMYCSDSGGDYRCPLDFLESPDSENRFTADMLEGNGKNQLAQVPDSYTDADVMIKTDDGSVIGVGQRARISGKMLIGEGVCLMTVDKVETISE